jgi:hypothetical protein
MSVGQQDHGGVAVPMPILAGRRDQPLGLFTSQVFTGANLGVAPALGRLAARNWTENGFSGQFGKHKDAANNQLSVISNVRDQFKRTGART